MARMKGILAWARVRCLRREYMDWTTNAFEWFIVKFQKQEGYKSLVLFIRSVCVALVLQQGMNRD